MFSNLLSARHGALRLSSALVAASAFLAACDNDSQPVAPKAPPVASAPVAGDPSLSPRVSGNIVIKLIDKNKNLISTGTAQLKITGPSNNTFWMYDNDASDSDSTTGQIVLKHLSTGTWKVCEVGPPNGYGVVGSFCQTTDVYVGATSGLFYTNAPITILTWSVKDNGANLVGGATVTLDSNNVVIGQILDNSPSDGDPVAGKFELPIPYETNYRICFTTAPQGYVLYPGQQTCFSGAIKMGMGVVDWGTFVVAPNLSASWKVTDGTVDANGQPTLIGPAGFRLTLGATSVDFADNGPADYDPTVGKIAVQLPFAGTYTICETVPPVNHWNANPACKQLNVASGVPVDLGLFVNYEKQVFKP
jgi:hypothetical protein